MLDDTHNVKNVADFWTSVPLAYNSVIDLITLINE